MSLIADRAAPDPSIEAAMDHPIWKAMERVPDKMRAALHLHYVEGYSIAEAANIMGCTEASARTRLHRGRKRLAEELERLNRSKTTAAQAVKNDGNAGSTPAHAQ